MTDVFALDTQGQAELERSARAGATRLGAIDEPGTFGGVFSGIGQGVLRGGARTGQFIGLAAAAPLALYEQATDQEGRFTDPYFGALDEYVTSAVDYWTPGAAEVGKAGQILGGLSEIALPLMAGGGNPALLIGSQTFGGSADLVREGVDADTAATVGVLQGLSTAVGFRVPILGKTLAARLGTGAAGNLALSVPTVAAQRAALNAAGTPEAAQAAERFDPLNAESAALDALTGIAFGGITHLQVRSADRAAAAAANNAKHFQSDTAPGRPRDMAAFVAHQRAMEQATEQLVRGEPVTPPASIAEASFEPRPTPDADATLASLREVLPESERSVTEIDPESRVSRATEPAAAASRADDQSIEARFRAQLGENPAETEARYAKLKDTDGGKVLNVDTARELSPDYLADRTRSAAVHEPASDFIKQLYAKKLAEAPKEGEAPLVLFTAGGAGAGKSTAVETALGPLAKTAQVVYDTNMNNLASSVKKIEQALAAGKDVNIVYVYRDPREALRAGALPRAMRQEAKFGTGRTVPLEAFLDTHVGSREVVTQLAERYADDPRVDIQAIDNSGGPDGARPVMLSEVPKFPGDAYTQLRGQANDIIEAERASGRISESVYRGFKEGSVEADGKGARSVAGEGARGESEPQRPPPDGRGPEAPDAGSQGRQEVIDPDVRAALEVVASRDLEIPTGELGPDGQPLAISAKELLAQADAALEAAKADSAAFDAAVSCFLRGGPP